MLLVSADSIEFVEGNSLLPFFKYVLYEYIGSSVIC